MSESTHLEGWPNRLAYALSVILHPIFLPTYLFATLFYSAGHIFYPLTDVQILIYLILIFITTAIIPLASLSLFYLMLNRFVGIKTFNMNNKKDRTLPFLFTGIIYSGVTWLLYSQLNSPILIIILLTTFTIAILSVTFINNFWKISAHSTAWGVVTGCLMILHHSVNNTILLIPFVSSILLSGMVLSSRLQLQAHSTVEVYMGYLFGIIISIIGLYELVFF
jgi:membrane-associated phospholipid phosphatase